MSCTNVPRRARATRRELLVSLGALAASAACARTEKAAPSSKASASVSSASRAAASGSASASAPATVRPPRHGSFTLLNVSYDATRELYADYNPRFSEAWLARTREVVEVKQSHGGSGSQSRAVLDGLDADVVTLALALDVSALAKQGGLLPGNWQGRLPFNSSPYTSTVVFLVRAGNPKRIRDFGDLARPGVSVITPNPKTGGGARWNYLATWGYAEKQPGATPASVRAFMQRFLKNVAVFDSGARGSTTTFVQRSLGDVLVTWENEAKLALAKAGRGAFQLIVPPRSILAEPPVSIVDRVVDVHGTRDVADAYLRGLYHHDAQELIAKHGYRPRDTSVLAGYPDDFPKLELFGIDAFGGWEKAQADHFAEGGTYDQLLARD